MPEIIIVNQPISRDDLEALKLKSGEDTNNGAISKAVEHYLGCTHVL